MCRGSGCSASGMTDFSVSLPKSAFFHFFHCTSDWVFHTHFISTSCIPFSSYSCNGLSWIPSEKWCLFFSSNMLRLSLPRGGGEKHQGTFSCLCCSEFCGTLPSPLLQGHNFRAFTIEFSECLLNINIYIYTHTYIFFFMCFFLQVLLSLCFLEWRKVFELLLQSLFYWKIWRAQK